MTAGSSQSATNSQPGHSSEQKLKAYLIAVLVIPAILYLPPFFLVRMPGYFQWSSLVDGPILELGYKAAGQNADVVIYGDSSAKHAVNPAQITAALDADTVDLPSNLPTLTVTDDLPLRHYLQRDKPPRVIVLYVAAWDLNYGNLDINSTTPYSGVEMLLRHGSLSQILRFSLSQPALMLQFPFMFYQGNFDLTALVGAKSTHQKLRLEQIEAAATHGHTSFPDGPALTPNCVIPSTLIDRIDYSWMRNLPTRYETPHTKVLVYIAPIPACTNAQVVLDKIRSVTPLALPKVMPPALFARDRYYTHLFSAGVPAATQDVIDAVRPLLNAK